MLRRRWLILCLLLVPLLPLWRAVTTGQAIGPFDQIQHMAPWNGPEPGRPWDVLQADGVLQFYGWRDLVFDAWGKGQLPFWNPYVLAGTPLMANSQSAALYPPHILMGVLHVPTGLAMIVLAWAHLAWAGLGTYVLIRRMGGSRLGGWLGGASFSLSPFMIAWTGLPSVITTVIWIPWMLAGIAGLFLSHPVGLAHAAVVAGAEQPTASERYRRDRLWTRSYVRLVAGLIASTAMMVLSGHLQFVAYGALASLLFAAGLACTSPRLAGVTVDKFVAGSNEASVGEISRLGWWTKPAGSGAVLTLSALVLGVLIAAPQLLPVFQYSQFSHRRAPPTAEGYKAYTGSAIRLFELGSLPFASLNGNPAHFAETPPEANLPKVATYWPVHVKQGANFAESAISLGPLVLALLFLAPWRKRWREFGPIALVGVVALLLALGTPLNMLLYYGLPGWSATGSPGRIGVLFVLAACVVAGLAIDRLPKLSPDGLRRLLALLSPALVSAVIIGLAPRFVGGELPPLVSQIAGQAMREAVPLLLVAIIVAVVAISSAHRLERVSAKMVIVVAPIALFALAGGLELIPTGDPSFLAAKSSEGAVGQGSNAHTHLALSSLERVAFINDAWSIASAPHALMPPNTGTVARIHELGGYDSLIHRDSVALLKKVDGKDPAPEANGNMMFVKSTADPQQLADAGVAEVVSRRELPQFQHGYLNNDFGLYHYKVSDVGRASTPQGPAICESESPSQLKLKATGPGTLVLRDRNMPGWLAKVDGKHVPIGGTTWREVDLPAGDHQVEFNYVPPGFMPGLGLGFIGILILIAVFLSSLSRPSKESVAGEKELEAK